MPKNVEQWLEEKRHLPECMKDFHDCKDLFKTIHSRIKPEPQIDFVTAQIYTVDVFLHFMARRGYTLQRNRSDVEFRDLEADISETIDKQEQAFANLIMGAMK